ncbi:RDD family protein, partial [Desulfosarcina cetonica]|uniref:RDD family protein n=1 Tax=Desulfosarcina cetonica TaxID=90730 RepID=UPI0006D25500
LDRGRLCIAATARIAGVFLTLLGVLSPDFSHAALILFFFILNMGYAMALEWFWHGQTVGKRLLGLRVMDLQGLELRFGQIAIRNLLRAVDSLPLCYLVGGVAALISRHSQRLGDIAANTVVIRETKAILQIPEDFLDPMRYNSLRAYPHLVARLRQHTVPGEAALAMQALMRRDELDADARVALFKDIAGHLQTKTAFPPEALENISDEQFVRNAVDVLFQSGP